MADRDDHRPRPHDHLVEPLFAGLGAERALDDVGRRRARRMRRLALVVLAASALALAILALR